MYHELDLCYHPVLSQMELTPSTIYHCTLKLIDDKDENFSLNEYWTRQSDFIVRLSNVFYKLICKYIFRSRELFGCERRMFSFQTG